MRQTNMIYRSIALILACLSFAAGWAGAAPAEGKAGAFVLSADNARRMRGQNDPEQERWCDLAGNIYSERFVRRFSYEDASATGLEVLVQWEERGPTLEGRLEARRLKPNFAYQVKLRGVYADKISFERIGSVGRWRLPGKLANNTDWDYRACTNKSQVEAYVFFDFFVTDGDGNAALDFAMQDSLHVLIDEKRQVKPLITGKRIEWTVDAARGDVYLRPKRDPTREAVVAQKEGSRYFDLSAPVRLPAGRYHAELVLTEESFHAAGRDLGFWATVMVLPLEFEIVGGPEGETFNAERLLRDFGRENGNVQRSTLNFQR